MCVCVYIYDEEISRLEKDAAANYRIATRTFGYWQLPLVADLNAAIATYQVHNRASCVCPRFEFTMSVRRKTYERSIRLSGLTIDRFAYCVNRE